MRFMMLMMPKMQQSYDEAREVAPEALEAMGEFNDQLTKAGVLLAVDGLHPPETGVRVSFSGGKAKATDGPFAETKELVGGYWMIDVKSKDEAVQWALRCPALEGDVIEVRQVQEFEEAR